MLRIPVLVNGESAVLKGHCVKSNGGLYYNSYHGFESKCLQLINNEALGKEMGNNGFDYVRRNYNWDIIIRKLSYLVEFVRENTNK